MQITRREFLKGACASCGVLGLAPWYLEAEIAEAAKVNKHDLAELALTEAKKAGATYADIRINRYRSESLVAPQQRIQNLPRSQNFRFGVRVLLQGAWGFASSYLVTPEAVRRVT